MKKRTNRYTEQDDRWIDWSYYAVVLVVCGGLFLGLVELLGVATGMYSLNEIYPMQYELSKEVQEYKDSMRHSQGRWAGEGQ